MRINKYLAECGVASRRGADKIIEEKRVKRNGTLVTELGVEIDEERDVITVDGKKIRPEKFQYYLLNKPKGYVTTVKDEHARHTVMELIKEADRVRLFPVGRLDYDTEGLLIITNDGDLAFRLTHPKNEVPKTYVAKIEGELKEADLAPLRKGVTIDGEMTKPAKVKLLGTEDKMSRVEVTITEGRNRQVRRMFESLGRRVEFLKRMRVGDLKVGGLSRGEYRKLRPDEIHYLKNL